LRVVFLGTSAFACPSLLALATVHEIILVITQPDRRAGRKQELTRPLVGLEADRLGLSVAQPERINSKETLRLLRQAAPEVIVVAAYGQILREVVFSLPPLGTINIHASLLPCYRGAAPINWAIIRGEVETGITTFLIEEGLDTGKILLQRVVSIGRDETAGELHDRLAALGAEVILDALAGLEAKTLEPVAQNDKEATVAPMLRREDGLISWQQRALELHNQVRGMNPWPGAYTHLGEARVKVHRTALTGVADGKVRPGEIALRETGRFLVGTADDLLEILEIQRESHPRMTGRAFLNGLRHEEHFT
jgi:methionyl-tRNA formyltransferase